MPVARRPGPVRHLLAHSTGWINMLPCRRLTLTRSSIPKTGSAFLVRAPRSTQGKFRSHTYVHALYPATLKSILVLHPCVKNKFTTIYFGESAIIMPQQLCLLTSLDSRCCSYFFCNIIGLVYQLTTYNLLGKELTLRLACTRLCPV